MTNDKSGMFSLTVESYWMLLVGRFIVGVGVGVASSIVQLNISELAPKHKRGSLGMV